MTKAEKKWLDKYRPDHHLTLAKRNRTWHVNYKGKVKCFSAVVYGSLAEAKKAAIDFRESIPIHEMHSDFDVSRYSQPQGVSGHQGINIIHNKEGEHIGWSASWREGPPHSRRSRSKLFNLKKYGDTALQAAIDERERQVKKNAVQNKYSNYRK